MNAKDEALKMAIEALQNNQTYDWKGNPLTALDEANEKVINACKEALEEAEKQEWQSLNADEIDDLWDESSKDVSGSIRLGYTTKQHYFYVLIEQALKEKNKC